MFYAKCYIIHIYFILLYVFICISLVVAAVAPMFQTFVRFLYSPISPVEKGSFYMLKRWCGSRDHGPFFFRNVANMKMCVHSALVKHESKKSKGKTTIYCVHCAKNGKMETMCSNRNTGKCAYLNFFPTDSRGTYVRAKKAPQCKFSRSSHLACSWCVDSAELIKQQGQQTQRENYFRIKI